MEYFPGKKLKATPSAATTPVADSPNKTRELKYRVMSMEEIIDTTMRLNTPIRKRIIENTQKRNLLIPSNKKRFKIEGSYQLSRHQSGGSRNRYPKSKVELKIAQRLKA